MAVLSRYHASDGATLRVRIAGAGPPLVLLHGWTSSHREWIAYADALAPDCRSYCWDARGHGGQPLREGEGAPGVERMARDLRDLLLHYDLRDVCLLGHSMGALTAWEYVRQFGCDRLSRLCLVDQSPRLVTDADWPLGIYGDFSAAENAAFIQRLENDFAEAVLQLAAYGLNPAAARGYRLNGAGIQRLRELLRRQDPGPLIAIWRSLSAADYRDVLPCIAIPTLLVHGAVSNFYSVAVADYLQARIAGARLLVYEGADHAPHLWQRERFLADLRGFLRER